MNPIIPLTLLAALAATVPCARAEQAVKDAPAPAAAKSKKTAATQPEKEKDRKSEMVCTNEPVTGSRFSRRVCHSREELEMMQRAGRDTVKKIQEMPLPLKGE